MRDQIGRVGGDELVNRCKPIWGLNSEGEINGAWRDLGIPNMWYIMGQFFPILLLSLFLVLEMMTKHFRFFTGNLALCRFHTSHVALRKPILLVATHPGLFY